MARLGMPQLCQVLLPPLLALPKALLSLLCLVVISAACMHTCTHSVTHTRAHIHTVGLRHHPEPRAAALLLFVLAYIRNGRCANHVRQKQVTPKAEYGLRGLIFVGGCRVCPIFGAGCGVDLLLTMDTKLCLEA